MTFALDIFAPAAPAPTGGSVRAESQGAALTDTAFADKMADATAVRDRATTPASETRVHAAKGHLIAPTTGAEATTGEETDVTAETDDATPDVPLVVAPEPMDAGTDGDTPADVDVDPQSAPVIPLPLSPVVQPAPVETAEAAAPTPAVVTPETPADAPDQGAAAPQTPAAVEPDALAAPTPSTVDAAPRSETAPDKTSGDAANTAEQPTAPAANDKTATDRAATDRAAAETLKAAAAPAPATPPVAAQVAILARPAPKPVAATTGEAAPTAEEPATPAQAGQAVAPEAARTTETPRPAVVDPAVPATQPPAHDVGRHAVSNAAAADSSAIEAASPAPVQDASGMRADTAANTPVPPPAPSAAPSAGDAAAAAATPEAAVEVAVETSRPAVTASTEPARNLALSQLSHATVETTAQIAAQIVRRLEGRSTRFDMVLTPEDLGRVEVRLEIDTDGQLAARLAFDNPAAATDLRGRADELRRQLQDAGFQLSDNALEFSQRDTSSGGGFDRRQDRSALFAGGSRLAAQADAAAAPAAWINLALTPDRVDMKV